MKKTANRILALIIALSMLLIPTAFAAERNAASVTIGNFEIVYGEETISLPLYLTLGGGADIEGARGYVTADLSTAEQSAISAVAALENGEIKAYLNGMNYGFVIPVEQLVSMLEEEMGASLEEVLAEAMAQAESSITPEMQTALAGLLETAANLNPATDAEMGPKELLTAMGATVTEVGQTTVTLFDVEAEATESELVLPPTTLKSMIDGLGSLNPDLDAFYDEYFKMLNQMLAEQGEEMTIEQAFEMITMGMTGTVWTAKDGAAGEVVLTVTVEDESIDMPMYMVTLTDELGTYNELIMDMPVDGEGLYLDVYADDFTDETGAYTNIIYSMSIYDAETEESEMDMMISLYASDTEEGYAVGAEIYGGEGEDVISAGISHLCYETILTEEADTYNGILYAYAAADDFSGEISMDTSLTLTSVPAGELLTFSQSVNPFEMDDETMEKVASDATNALIPALGVLMQDPTIAGMLGSLM